MTTTRVSQLVRAPRAAVYRAILDPEAIRRWMVPDGMTSEVHAFDAREGGCFRITLTYDAPTDAGKTTAQSDSFAGRFARLVPDEQVVQVVAFDAADAAMQGEMTITYDLREVDGGTEVVGTHANVPPGVSPEDNELGWRMSLGKLAALVEGG